MDKKYNPRLKKGWKEIARALAEHGIVTLYHFTDQSNLQSIIENGGLFSWFVSRRDGLDIPYPGGNDLSRRLDRKKHLEDYVRLCLNQNHPMVRRAKIPNPVYLRVSTRVAYWEDTLFSNINAAANAAQIGSDLGALNRIDFDLAQKGIWHTDEEKGLVQAEILVKRYIPLAYIVVP